MAISMIALPLLLLSCAGTPPTKVENSFFMVATSSVPIVTWKTNIMSGPNGPIPVIEATTNWVEAYDFTPGANAQAVIETGTTIGNFFGVGGIVGTLLTALFGVWAKMRSSTNRKTAAVLAQIIEAGRQLMDTTPQGKQLEGEWVSWMQKHQTETGVILEVAKLLKQVVDNESAKRVADELIKMTTPQPAEPQPPTNS